MRSAILVSLAFLTPILAGTGCHMVRCSFAPTASCQEGNEHANYAQLGQSCAQAYCYADGYCDDAKICRALKPEGAACSSISECAKGACNGGFCRS